MTRILALDAGTTGVTAVIFDGDLRPVQRAYAEFPQHFPEPGWVEHRADEILAAVDRVLAEVLAGSPGRIDAMGLTNQRETLFALDRRTGRALGPGIVWQDRRTSARCLELKAAGLEAKVRRTTGLLLDPYFSGTKAEWMLRERPAVAAAAQAGELDFVTVDGLVARHLSVGEGTLTDFTNASRTLLFDIDSRAWDADLCAELGVPLDSLPSVHGSTADFGMAQLPGGQSAPLTGLAGDQQAALFGQACWEPGECKATYGTGVFLVQNAGAKRPDSDNGLLTTLAVGRAGQPVYALEGSVFSGGLVIQWLRDGLGILAQASESEAMARRVPDCGGVHLVPAFAGLGAPYWDPDARAALLGMTRGSTSEHIVRAALECIALQCTEVIELLRDASGLPVDQLRVDGGATANNLLMEMQADFSGARILRAAEAEATARGAAALAALGANLLDDPGQAAAFADAPQVFEPSIDPGARAERLVKWRAAVARVRS
ncbi:MAG: glycerol kinase [Planctomycetota bacterium]